MKTAKRFQTGFNLQDMADYIISKDYFHNEFADHWFPDYSFHGVLVSTVNVWRIRSNNQGCNIKSYQEEERRQELFRLLQPLIDSQCLNEIHGRLTV